MLRYLQLLVSLLLFWFSVTFCVAQSKWSSYTASTPSRNLYMTFQHPPDLTINGVENGICLNRIIKPKSKPEDKNYPTQWCIWFMDASRNIEECIANEKIPKEKNSKVILTDVRDTVQVAGQNALRVLLKNDKTKNSYVELIFFEKEGILFEIDNRKFDTPDFDTFLKSITF